MDNIFCQNCGAKIDKGSQFCGACGTQFGDVADKKEIQQGKTTAGNSGGSNSKSGAKKVVGVIIGIIAFLVAYSFVTGFFSSGTNSSSSADAFKSSI